MEIASSLVRAVESASGMVLFNYSTKELTAKVVYYGPALCGKTSNLQWIHEKLPIKNKGKMLSLATETDRTLFFDFLPIEIGAIRGMRTRIQLYTVPGQVFYNATRRMVLKGADAIVFVCDSQEPMLDANLESHENLRQNLEANEISPDEIPIVFQFNKRDLPNALPIEILNERLNPQNFPFYEAIAPKGVGVEDTLKAVTKLVFRSLSARYGDSMAAAQPARSGAPRSTSFPGSAVTSGAPLAAATGDLLGELSFTPKPPVAAPATPRPPSQPASLAAPRAAKPPVARPAAQPGELSRRTPAFGRGSDPSVALGALGGDAGAQVVAQRAPAPSDAGQQLERGRRSAPAHLRSRRPAGGGFRARGDRSRRFRSAAAGSATRSRAERDDRAGASAGG